MSISCGTPRISRKSPGISRKRPGISRAASSESRKDRFYAALHKARNNDARMARVMARYADQLWRLDGN